MDPRQILQSTEPFVQLPPEALESIAQAAVSKKFPAHSLIFKRHDPPTGYLYVIARGEVEIVALTPGGVEMVVDVRHPHTFLGGTPIFTGDNYTAGARTVTETECLLLPQAALTEVANRYPHIIQHFTRAILSRVRSLYTEMLSEHGRSARLPVEAFPFQKRLGEIMSTPVQTCTPEAPVRNVARKMTEQGVGAIVVVAANQGAAGVITETDLIAKVLARDGIDLDTLCAQEIMTAEPEVMTADAYMFEAATLMMRRKIRHLPILEEGRVVGMVALRDVMRYRSQKSMLLVESIREAGNLGELAAANTQIVAVAKALLSEARSHFETMEILSYLHHCILRRCFELVQEEMTSQGQSPPEVRFSLMIMGSGGRREMLLGPDQDNGLIYEDFPDDQFEVVDGYFQALGERLVTAFEQVGYPRCNGKVMANNPLWRGRLKDWRARINNWVQVPEPKKVMYSTIFLDFMPLAGDPSLCQDLREILHDELRGNTVFLYYLLENNLNHAPPVNLLGRFVLEKDGAHKGMLSLKQAGSVFIVDCVRMFLLEQGLHATTTLERLEELVRLKVFNPATAENLKAALEVFIFFRLRLEISLVDRGLPPSHYLDPYSLTKSEQDLLLEAFRSAGKLQDSARRHFSHGQLQ